MNRYFFCALFVVSSFRGLGQNSDTFKSLFLELGGSAGVWSINLEQPVHKIKKPGFAFRMGVGLLPIDKNNGFLFTLPFAISYIQGKQHKVESFFGHSISLTTKGQFFGQLTPGLGYRYERPHKKVFYRLVYAPLISYLLDFQYQHWVGISIGIKLANK